MTYEETLKFIHSVQWRGSKPGLSRTRELLARIGDPQKKLKFVHVAGTNGKGSTAALIASVLRTAGYRTGLYISPFVTRFNERVQVDGEEIPDEDLVRTVEAIRPFAESMEDRPTEFEIITALAMEYFLERRCDIVVLEVGMGGELDSTNVIDTPEAAVITAIGYDHMKELGSTLTLIAKAKAGIIKPGGRVAAYGGVPEADAVLRARCEETGSSLVFTDFSALDVENCGLGGCVFRYKTYGGLKIPLAGIHQPKNAALAVEAVEILRSCGFVIPDGALYEGFRSVKWPGRMETLLQRPVFLLDGAHNPHGARAAAESLRTFFPGKKILFILGVMADKDVAGILDQLLPLAERCFTVKPVTPRAMDDGVLAALIWERGIAAVACGTPEEGVRRALQTAGEDGVICAAGSLYFSADIRAAVRKFTQS